MAALEDRIWTTMKTRMISESRYRLYNVAANYWITSLSLMLIIISIYGDDIQNTIPAFSKLNLALSVLIFTISIIIPGLNLTEKANRHRLCYLQLHEILNGCKTHLPLNILYQDILSIYDNHAERDYDDLIVANYCKRKKPIKAPGSDDCLVPSKMMITSYYFRKVASFLFCYILPVICVLFLIIAVA